MVSTSSKEFCLRGKKMAACWILPPFHQKSKQYIPVTTFRISLQVTKTTAKYQQGNHRSVRQKKREQKVTLMIMMTVIAYAVVWSPYAIVCLLRMVGHPVTPTVVAFPMLFAKSGTCWNPIIYVALNTKVRVYHKLSLQSGLFCHT